MFRTSSEALWLTLLLGGAPLAFAQSPDLDAPAPEELSREPAPVEASPIPEPVPSDASEARANLWETTFSPDAIASYFEGAGLRVAVLGAGAFAADREDAEAALIAALRLSGAAELVMDDGALGDASALSDEALLKAAAALPVERIVVLRIFPTGPEAPPMAVVTIYNKAGAVLTAFTTPRGTPVEGRREGGVAVGVGGESASAKAEPDPGAIPEGDTRSPEEIYEEEKLTVVDGRGIPMGSGGSVSEGLKIVQGPYHLPVSSAEVVTLLDDPDLNQRYQQRQATGKRLIVVGIIMTAAGFPVLLAGEPVNGFEPIMVVRGATGATLLALGPSLAYGGLLLRRRLPMKPPELIDRVDTYNKDLKASLGLSALPRLRPRVALGPGGGFLGLEGQF